MEEKKREILEKKLEVLSKLEEKGFSKQDVATVELLLDETERAFAERDEEKAKKLANTMMEIIIENLI